MEKGGEREGSMQRVEGAEKRDEKKLGRTPDIGDRHQEVTIALPL